MDQPKPGHDSLEQDAINKAQAKKIFFEYCCNHFFMSRELTAGEYEKFAISAEEEANWRREFIEYWISQLSLDDLAPVRRLTAAEAWEALPALMTRGSEGDSFAKFWYAFHMWDIARAHFITISFLPERQDPAITALCRRAQRTAIGLWQSILVEPIRLTGSHRAEISEILPHLTFGKGFQASTPEEYLVSYAKIKLAEAQVANKPR